jgi:predicted ABC-type ATPase
MPVPRRTIYLIAKEFLPRIGVVRFLNADEIARGLSPLKPEAVAFKAGRLLLSELRELIDGHETFALESTLSGQTYVNLFEKAKQRGYAIELHFVWIPDVREAIRRVRQRVIEGGHDVPAEDIRRRFARSIQHLLKDYAPLASKWFLWDNSMPPAKLLAESATHSIIELRTFFSFHEEKSV